MNHRYKLISANFLLAFLVFLFPLLLIAQVKIHDWENPASKYLHLSTIEGVTDVRIFNMLGQPLISKTNSETPTIDISGLNSGLYLIRIRKEAIRLSDLSRNKEHENDNN